MSDILIKNMEIPKDYKYVDVRIFRDGTATTSSAEEPFYKRMDVIELPKHGRLIDADALSERIEEQRNTEYAMKNKPHGSWRRVLELSLNMISDAPTIIEAENGT